MSIRGFLLALVVMSPLVVCGQNVRISAPIGQKTKANSVSVTHASDDTQPLPSGAATSAKQDTQITAEQAIQAAAGATNGAKVVTDANGTLQQYLRGIVYLLINPLATNSAAKQYTGAPSTFTPATTDATVFTLAAGEVGFIQNLSADAPLATKKGAGASTSSFSFILKAGTAVDDGNGGAIEIKDWVGVVSVAKISGTARYIAWKQAP